MPSSGEKSRYWMFTTNNPDVHIDLSDTVTLIVEQPEQPDGVGWHRQGYAEFNGRLSGRAVSRALGFPEMERGSKSEHFYKCARRRGSKSQAIAYCSSKWYCHDCHEGDHSETLQLIVWDYETQRDSEEMLSRAIGSETWKSHCRCVKAKLKGKVGPTVVKGKPFVEGRGKQGGQSTGRGQGLEQERIIAAINAGQTRRDIFQTFPLYCARYHSWVDKAVTLYAPVRKWMPHVYWLYGAAGTDKSRMARAVLENSCYCKAPDSKWFDGYDGHDVLVVNDLRKSTFTFSYLLEMLDRYEFRVEVKGGCVPLLAKVIIITCSKSHSELWAELGGTANEHLQQLTRRIRREFCLPAPLNEKQELVTEMRRSVQILKDPSNWDADELYGKWDGKSEIPVPAAKRLKRYDDTRSDST